MEYNQLNIIIAVIIPLLRAVSSLYLDLKFLCHDTPALPHTPFHFLCTGWHPRFWQYLQPGRKSSPSWHLPVLERVRLTNILRLQLDVRPQGMQKG